MSNASEYWTVVFLTIYQFVVLLGYKFLFHVQREDKSLAVDVAMWWSTFGVPRVVRISTDSFAKVSADKDESILFIIAFLMEGSRTKVVLGCSEQSFYLYHFSGLIYNFVEKLSMLWAKDFRLKKSLI